MVVYFKRTSRKNYWYKPTKGHVRAGLYVEKRIWAKVKAYAEEKKVTLTSIANEAFKEWLDAKKD